VYCEVERTIRDEISKSFMMAHLWRYYCRGSTALVGLGLFISEASRSHSRCTTHNR